MKIRTGTIITLLILFITNSILKAQIAVNTVDADTFKSELGVTSCVYQGNAIKTKKISNNNILMLHHLHVIGDYNNCNYYWPYDSIQIIKYSAEGNKRWEKNYPLTGGGIINDFIETPDHGFLLIGDIGTNNSLVKLDSLGNIIFIKNFSNPGLTISLEKIVATEDNNYIIISNDNETESENTDCYPYFHSYDIHSKTSVTKINNSGNILWQKLITDSYLKSMSYTFNYKSTFIDVLKDGSNRINIVKPYAADYTNTAHYKFYQLDANGLLINEHYIGDSTSVDNACISSLYYSFFSLSENGFICSNAIAQDEVYFYKNRNLFYDKNGIFIDSSFSLNYDLRYNNVLFTDVFSPFNSSQSNIKLNGKYYSATTYNGTAYDGLILSETDNIYNVIWAANHLINSERDNNESNYLTAINDSTILIVLASQIINSENQVDDIIIKFITLSIDNNQLDYSIYIDQNNNGIHDTDDVSFSDCSIELNNGSTTVDLQPSEGNYTKYLFAGNYLSKLISYNQTLKYFNVDPISKNTIFTSNTTDIDSVIFRLTPKPNIEDLQVSIVPTSGARPGFNSSYKIIAKNVGTKIMYLPTVKFVKDSLQSFNDTVYTIDSDTLFWQIDSLNLLEQREISVSILNAIPPTLNANDTLHLTAVIFPIENDSFLQDNYASLNQVVVNSVDPNDKIETHGGTIPYSAVQNRYYLYYTIRFQNTGNSYASRIVINDTLTENVDASTLEFLSSSVPFAMNVVNRKYITWTAASTYLPDSIADEANSHGYISFRIKPKAGLFPSDEITNRACIIFDYNAAISTNTCTTKIIEQRILSVKNNEIKSIHLFPNPTNGNVQLNMNLLQNKNYSLRIIDINGNLLSTQNIKGNSGENNIELNLSSYANGLYFIQLSDETGNLFYGKVVKE
jgi:hypothetical protein